MISVHIQGETAEDIVKQVEKMFSGVHSEKEHPKKEKKSEPKNESAPETKAEAPKTAPASAPVQAAPGGHTQEEVGMAIAKLLKTKGKDQVIALFAKFNAKRTSELKVEDYGKFLEEAAKLSV